MPDATLHFRMWGELAAQQRQCCHLIFLPGCRWLMPLLDSTLQWRNDANAASSHWLLFYYFLPHRGWLFIIFWPPLMQVADNATSSLIGLHLFLATMLPPIGCFLELPHQHLSGVCLRKPSPPIYCFIFLDAGCRLIVLRKFCSGTKIFTLRFAATHPYIQSDDKEWWWGWLVQVEMKTSSVKDAADHWSVVKILNKEENSAVTAGGEKQSTTCDCVNLSHAAKWKLALCIIVHSNIGLYLYTAYLFANKWMVRDKKNKNH